MLTSAVGNKTHGHTPGTARVCALPPPVCQSRESRSARCRRVCPRSVRGFTLLELLVVLAIIAMATAGVTLALRDSSQTALEREADRLAVLFESARAQSRASGVPVQWQPSAEGFRFDGLPPDALPTRWLAEGTAVRGSATVQLGPEPIIGPQSVELFSLNQPSRAMRIATDGLRPFAVQATSQP